MPAPSDDLTESVTLGEVYRLVRRIDHTLHGNGQPGLVADVADLKRFRDMVIKITIAIPSIILAFVAIGTAAHWFGH